MSAITIRVWAMLLLTLSIPAAVAQAEAPVATDSLSKRLAAGQPYVIVTRRNLFPLPSEGKEYWFAIDGYYVPEDGTWTSHAVGFPTPGTPWHSCPATARCGGIHEPGKRLDRWYRPELNEMIVVGQHLTFDQHGRLFHQGKQIGLVFTPDFPTE